MSSSALPTGAFVPLSGMGFDFAGFAFRLVQPDRRQRPDRRLHAGDYSPARLQGVFTLQCGSLPPYASCTFNPRSEGIPANTTGNEIGGDCHRADSDLGPLVAAVHARPSAWPVFRWSAGCIAPAVCPPAAAQGTAADSVLAILAAGVSSCTDSEQWHLLDPAQSGSGITPVGTYSIPVTAISNGVQHQVTLTLTVD